MFVQKFLIEQNLRRFTGGDAAHTLGGPINLVFFLPIILLGMAPWSFRIPSAWPRRATSDPLSRYLATCAVIPFLFFSLSGAKLVHYVLPCFVPLALLIADEVASRWSEDGVHLPEFRWRQLGIGVLVMAVLANVGFHAVYRLTGHAEVHAMAHGVLARDGREVAAYQMPRRQADRGTGRAKLQETSHPSLAFVLDRVIHDVESFEELSAVPRPIYIITRAGRIAEASPGLEKVTTSDRGNYELWLLE
jgi:hypothetical protein